MGDKVTGGVQFDGFVNYGVCWGCEKKWQAAKKNKARLLGWVAKCRVCEDEVSLGWKDKSAFVVQGWLCHRCFHAKRPRLSQATQAAQAGGNDGAGASGRQVEQVDLSGDARPAEPAPN